METFIQLTASGAALGAMYALVALGFVVIYRASQVFNFAHGQFLTFGALSMITLSEWGLPWAPAFVGAIVGTGILAALVERIALRPLVGRPVFVTIMVTIFVGMILRTVFLVIWGTEQYGMPTPWDDRMSNVNVLGAQVSLSSVATVGVSLLGLAIFFLLIRYTRLGVAMRAAASDQETSLALGIPVGRIFGATWFIAGLYAALGGIFLGMSVLSPVQVGHGDVAFRAFPAVIVGGLESPLGAVIAGLMLGILEVLTESYLNDELGQFGQNFHAVAPYFVMILVLIIRPYGLFGAKTVRRL